MLLLLLCHYCFSCCCRDIDIAIEINVDIDIGIDMDTDIYTEVDTELDSEINREIDGVDGTDGLERIDTCCCGSICFHLGIFFS